MQTQIQQLRAYLDAARARLALYEWDEAKHPRQPSGSDKGGEFAPGVHGESVPPNQLNRALEHVRKGGSLIVPTMTRVTIIKQKHIDQWDKFGKPLLRAEGEGYRMRTSAKTSVFLLPGQLRFGD